MSFLYYRKTRRNTCLVIIFQRTFKYIVFVVVAILRMSLFWNITNPAHDSIILEFFIDMFGITRQPSQRAMKSMASLNCRAWRKTSNARSWAPLSFWRIINKASTVASRISTFNDWSQVKRQTQSLRWVRWWQSWCSPPRIQCFLLSGRVRSWWSVRTELFPGAGVDQLRVLFLVVLNWRERWSLNVRLASPLSTV